MNDRWPNVLAARLQADAALSGIGVLNAGLNGNRLLHNEDQFGDSALKLLNRDVLTQAGAQYLTMLEGINDIGHIVKPSVDDPAETAQRIIRTLQQIATPARSQGMKVIGATKSSAIRYIRGAFGLLSIVATICTQTSTVSAQWGTASL